MIADTANREAFIRQNTRLFAVPHTPEISLHMADEATTLWQSTEDELGKIGLPPPFWAFAWAGGQALARYVLDNPELVRGLRVLDFASGSGLVAIAAAKAGAAHVEAADIDMFAVAAIRLNARINAVESIITTTLTDMIDNHGRWDIVLAGDICYQRDIAERVIAWLKRVHDTGTTVLIGDPGRSYLPRDVLVAVATYQVPTTRALEDMEIKNSSVWQFTARCAARDTE